MIVKPRAEVAAPTPDGTLLWRFLSILSPRKKNGGIKCPFYALPVRRPVDMARIISHFDEDGDGKISPVELRNCMRALGENLTMEEAESAVEFADSDGDGLLDLEYLAQLAGGEGDDENRRSLKKAFQIYDMEGEGCITPKSLKATLGRLGEARSVEDCEVMIGRFDVDGDGVLNFEEFRMMMI